ncbi:MAG: hypothetical protein AAF901_14380 [Bacteroidota bacterium]
MKNLLELGKSLTRSEQQKINGGASTCCVRHLCWTIDCVDGDPCIPACNGLSGFGTMQGGLCCID